MQKWVKRWMLCVCLSCTLPLISSKNSSSSSLELYCEVDYIGTIRFTLNLPEKVDQDLLNELFFMTETSSSWEKLNYCVIKHRGSIYECDMKLLTHHKFKSKKFHFSMQFTGDVSKTVYNFTDFYFSGKRNELGVGSSSPWITSKRFTECSDSFGTKFLGLVVGTNEINITWIQYPLSVDFRDLLNRTTLIVQNKAKNYYKSMNIENNDLCVEDRCFYRTIVDDCHNVYSVCIETEFRNGKLDRKCKNIRPYCTTRKKVGSFKWQEGLLMVFGCVIIFVCLGVSVYIFNRYRQEQNVSDLMEPVFPRPDTNCSNDFEPIYNYPDLSVKENNQERS